MLRVSRAARAGREFVRRSRVGDGYRLDWPPVRATGVADPARAPEMVARLRLAGRMLDGFYDPVEDALFLTAGLRRLGYRAVFRVGRQIAPAAPPAGLWAWVECGGQVVSTSLPVTEEYIPVLTVTERDVKVESA
jgi:hypothetical protein